MSRGGVGALLKEEQDRGGALGGDLSRYLKGKIASQQINHDLLNR